MTPRLQMSVARAIGDRPPEPEPAPSPSAPRMTIISGAMKPFVPKPRVWRTRSVAPAASAMPSDSATLASPKSITHGCNNAGSLFETGSIKIFEGFTSRCNTPASCALWMASAATATISATRRS